ncbi:MAG: AMP-binding protein, partial [Deltaproteobacteria bacterium]|nr:AMP-binding protein [Deltaproteobacteria bacterium]
MREDTIPTLFYGRVKEMGDEVAMRQKIYGIWEDISWKEYGEKVREVACGLIELGLEKGDCVSVIGENCPDWLYTDMGTMCAGGVSVGIYTTNSSEEVQYVLQNSRSKFYIVENEEQLDKALEVRPNLPDLIKIIVIDMEGLRNFHDAMVMSFEELLEIGRERDKRDPDLFEFKLN